jgi:hypothetical protein
VIDRYAWTSKVEQVAPSVHRIPLPLPNDGLRAVNVYAIQGPDGTGLIDGGWFIPEALDTLRNSLAEIGVGIHDITTVLATHFHRDHYTMAIELRRLTGCAVALGAPERATVDAVMAGERALDRLLALSCSPASRCGIPTPRRSTSTRHRGWPTVTARWPGAVRWKRCRRLVTPRATSALPMTRRDCCSPATTCCPTSRRRSASRPSLAISP